MSSNQYFGQCGQQLIFEPFSSLMQPSASKKPGKSKKAFGLFGESPLVQPFKFPSSPYQYKVVALRECPTPEEMQLCDTPQRAADYWKLHIATHPLFDPERECFAVLLLNARFRIKGHQLVSTGTMETVLVHPREVFRLAVTTSAFSIILAHNHPSGEPQPSEADIKVTRDLIRAGQLMRIEVRDHIIMGNRNHTSLRELGYFYS